jgi:nitrogen fixation/metabolism regulation signal transduction histidine kinase
MRYTIYFALQFVAVIALAVTIAYGLQWWWVTVSAIFLLTTFVLAYNAVAKPLRTVQNGIYLLREQDFSSRLREVGQVDADKVVHLFNDIMGTMKAERLKNHEQNDFLQKVIQASPMGIAICDFDAHITNTNPAFDAMYSDELNSVLDSLADGESQVFRTGHSQILRCTRSYFMECGFKRPFFQVERLTDEILKAETAIFNKIVRTMGHEVNNTLGSVTSVLQTLKDMHIDDDFIATTICSSIESCDRLGQFVKGYADVVKLPEAKLVLIDLNTVVTESLPGLQHLAPANITVDAELYGQPIYANIDTILFERVLVNIIKNAVDSIGTSNGKIVITTAPHTLCVTDNGPGISAENASKLFTPFFSTKNQDRGLGLMLIADILRKHGADYSLRTANSLTSFNIIFP